MPASAPQELPRGSRGSLAETNRPSGSVYTLPYHFCYPPRSTSVLKPIDEFLRNKSRHDSISIRSIIALNRQINRSFLDHKVDTSFFRFLSMFKNVSRSKRERVVYRREIRPVGRERCEMRSEAENPKEGIASQRRKRVSNIHVAEHVSGDKPLSRKPLVLLLSLRKEALQIVAGLPRTFQPYRSSLPRINVAKLPINPCHCRLIAVISSGNQDRLLHRCAASRNVSPQSPSPIPLCIVLIRRTMRPKQLQRLNYV